MPAAAGDAPRDGTPRLPDAVEEMIRWVTPVKAIMRTARVDHALHGVRIRAGEAVLLSYPSANRDESVFPDPHRFDVHRTSNRQPAVLPRADPCPTSSPPHGSRSTSRLRHDRRRLKRPRWPTVPPGRRISVRVASRSTRQTTRQQPARLSGHADQRQASPVRRAQGGDGHAVVVTARRGERRTGGVAPPGGPA
ncbi:cytochrome P450 [Streptomyces sp. NPDC004069]